MRRLCLIVLLGAGATALLGAAPASADPIPKDLVGVHVNDDGTVCVGISYQVPYCTEPID